MREGRKENICKGRKTHGRENEREENHLN